MLEEKWALTDTDTRHTGLTESIIELVAQGEDLFSISKATETHRVTGNGEHEGVWGFFFLTGFQ